METKEIVQKAINQVSRSLFDQLWLKRKNDLTVKDKEFIDNFNEKLEEDLTLTLDYLKKEGIDPRDIGMKYIFHDSGKDQCLLNIIFHSKQGLVNRDLVVITIMKNLMEFVNNFTDGDGVIEIISFKKLEQRNLLSFEVLYSI